MRRLTKKRIRSGLTDSEGRKLTQTDQHHVGRFLYKSFKQIGDMQTTTTNPTSHNQYFRKVKTDWTFKKTFKVLGLYFTVSNCRVKKRHAGRCTHCGRKFDFDVMELHHVLPYARFQDLITDDRNMILLCHKCHKEVHCNPFLNIQLMQAKADELGIDLHDRYDYGKEGE